MANRTRLAYACTQSLFIRQIKCRTVHNKILHELDLSHVSWAAYSKDEIETTLNCFETLAFPYIRTRGD